MGIFPICSSTVRQVQAKRLAFLAYSVNFMDLELINSVLNIIPSQRLQRRRLTFRRSLVIITWKLTQGIYFKISMICLKFTKPDIANLCQNYSDVGIYDRIVVQELIKDMASTAQLNTTNLREFKVVVLHEVDQLSKDAQHSLRRTMERYMKTCRLILCTESLSKVGVFPDDNAYLLDNTSYSFSMPSNTCSRAHY